MKFTGILASLAIASTASAVAIPTTQVKSVLVRLDGVLDKFGPAAGLLDGLTDTVEGTVSTVTGALDLKLVQTQLETVHTDLSGLLGNGACGVSGNGVLAEVTSLPSTVVTTVTGLGSTLQITQLSSMESLAGSLIDGFKSGNLDAAGLTSILQVVGMNGGLGNLNTVLANVQ